MTATFPTSSTTSSCPFGSAVKATTGRDWAGEFEASGYVARRSQRFLHLAHFNDTFAITPRGQVTYLSRPSAWTKIACDRQCYGETIPSTSLGETRRAKQHLTTPRSSENLGGAPDVHLTVFIVRVTQHGWNQPSVSYVADSAQTINRPSQTCLTGSSTGTISALPTTRTTGNTLLLVYHGSWGEYVSRETTCYLLPTACPRGFAPWATSRDW